MQSILHTIIGPSAPPTVDLKGKVAVVTGGALGIGYECSRILASMGCKVWMVNRKEDQGEAAIETIHKAHPGSDVEWVGCDLGSVKETKEVMGGLASKLERLDYVGGLRIRRLKADTAQLICSSGINTNQFGLDADGIDRHFGAPLAGPGQS